MKEFFRYLRGYLKIKVWGYSPERFMNLCSNHHILLWDIARQEDCYTMYISLSDFYKLRPIVKKTGTRQPFWNDTAAFFYTENAEKKGLCPGASLLSGLSYRHVPVCMGH